MSQWTVFSNHGHVLLFIAQQPEARLRDIAGQVGITERAVQKIIKDLQDDGFISVRKHGRRNRYRVQTRKALRHALEAHCSVGELVSLVHGDVPSPRRAGSSVSGGGTGPVSSERATDRQDVEATREEAEEAGRPDAVPAVDSPVEIPPEPVPAKESEPSSAPEPQDPGDKKPVTRKKAARKKVDDSQGSLF